MRKALITLAILILSVTTVSTSYAADLEITCGSSGLQNKCAITKGTTIFNESAWAPGSTVVKTLHVTNDDRNDTCNLKMYTDGVFKGEDDLSQHIFTAIQNTSMTYFGTVTNSQATNTKTLQDLFDTQYISLGKIGKNNTADYTWYATFDPEAQNELQNTKVTFNINLEFKCENETKDDHGDPQKKITNNKPGTPTPPLPPIIRNIVSLPATIANVAGAAIQAPTLIKEQPPEVEGAKTAACTQPWFIWIIIALQVLTQAAINKFVKKDRPLVLYTLNLLTMAISGFVIYKLACSWIYNVVALVLGIVMLVLRKRD